MSNTKRKAIYSESGERHPFMKVLSVDGFEVPIDAINQALWGPTGKMVIPSLPQTPIMNQFNTQQQNK